ncbi:phosphopantetheine-binding protein [Butyrivibrio sp. XPD2002]|uniref:phosphopantetheine-binding protein n=1 Tax=Butyrivibrio sp. XPD2002 TaxID=1280665 RepID=UPI0004036535|nr:phosphopantetheine-binding protein [Butyrivibrio sp. XPD2002]
MKEKIIRCIKSIKGEEFEETTNLVNGGILDSTDVIELIDKLEQEFDIMIPMDEADPDYFNSIELIEKLVQRNMGK